MTRRWYLWCLVPLAIGALAVVLSARSGAARIEQMERLEVPGERTLVLVAGDYVIYGETTVMEDAPAFSVQCKLIAFDGTSVPIDLTTSQSTYAMGDYKLEALLETTVAKDGRYTLACTGDKTVVAIGQGLGLTILTFVGGGLGGLCGAGTVFLIVFLRRRRSRQRFT